MNNTPQVRLKFLLGICTMVFLIFIVVGCTFVGETRKLTNPGTTNIYRQKMVPLCALNDQQKCTAKFPLNIVPNLYTILSPNYLPSDSELGDYIFVKTPPGHCMICAGSDTEAFTLKWTSKYSFEVQYHHENHHVLVDNWGYDFWSYIKITKNAQENTLEQIMPGQNFKKKIAPFVLGNITTFTADNITAVKFKDCLIIFTETPLYSTSFNFAERGVSFCAARDTTSPPVTSSQKINFDFCAQRFSAFASFMSCLSDLARQEQNASYCEMIPTTEEYSEGTIFYYTRCYENLASIAYFRNNDEKARFYCDKLQGLPGRGISYKGAADSCLAALSNMQSINRLCPYMHDLINHRRCREHERIILVEKTAGCSLGPDCILFQGFRSENPDICNIVLDRFQKPILQEPEATYLKLNCISNVARNNISACYHASFSEMIINTPYFQTTINDADWCYFNHAWETNFTICGRIKHPVLREECENKRYP